MRDHARQQLPYAALALSIIAIVVTVSVSRSAAHIGRQSIPARAPSLAELNRALALATPYIRSLYRPVGKAAVTSDFYALPLRVYLRPEGKWLLLGQDGSVASSAVTRFASETYRASFAGNHGPSPALAVRIDWRFRPRAYRISLTVLRFADKTFAADIYLDDLRIGTASKASIGQTWHLVLARTDRTPLRSFRYTVRHGTQLAQNYYRYIGDQERDARIVRFIRSYGFALNGDLTAPLWGQGVSYADDLAYDAGLVYHDCATRLPSTALAYAYRSKVCSTSRGLYIWLTHSDPLAPTLQALHALQREHEPDRKMSERRLAIALPIGADPRAIRPADRSPRQIAAWLESLYRGNHVGIPRCLPAHCESGWASGVRTFEFGALEAALGYRYRDAISRTYADATARLALELQVGPDGIVRTNDGLFYRPAAIGGFLYDWDRNRRTRLKQTLTDEISRKLSMSPEFRGIVVSNTETTLTAYAFLVAYRCVRYQVGCKRDGAWNVRQSTSAYPRLSSGWVRIQRQRSGTMASRTTASARKTSQVAS